jgi:hypothetical protein
MKNNEDFDNVEEIIYEIHSTAKEKGFWDSMDSIVSKVNSLVGIKNGDIEFTEEEAIQIRKAFIAQKIMLIVSELGEGIESDRKSEYSEWENFSELYAELLIQTGDEDKAFKTSFEDCIKDTFEDEIADAIIRIFDLTYKEGIDIMKHIQYKMKYNKSRDRLHGKEY